MSAIQTLPFSLDEHPADGQNNYETQKGKTYINASDSGLYRLVKWTGAAQAGGALAGVPIAASSLAAPYDCDVLGGSTNGPNFVGIVHPSMTAPVAVGDYLLVACGGLAYGVDNGVTPLVAGDTVGAAVGAATLGAAIDGDTDVIVRQAVGVAGLVYAGMVLVEFVQEPKVQIAA